jgi:predicted Zn-dependent protease
MSDRIEKLQRMLEQRPDDARIRFGLAAEHERAGQWEAVVEQLRAYLARADDEGNAWGRLGHALRLLGRRGEAKEAYLHGMKAAERHGHPTMVEQFREIVSDMD